MVMDVKCSVCGAPDDWKECVASHRDEIAKMAGDCSYYESEIDDLQAQVDELERESGPISDDALQSKRDMDALSLLFTAVVVGDVGGANQSLKLLAMGCDLDSPLLRAINDARQTARRTA